MRLGLTYLVLLFAVTLKAQQLSFFKPDNLKQLPSSECYNIMQDSRGYIWFSTEAGLCRYNGNSLRVFNGKEGLKEGATYNVWEGLDGRIWMTTPKSRVLCYDYKKDTLAEASCSKACEALFNTGLQQIYLERQGADSSLWFCSQMITARVNPQTGKITRVRAPDSSYHFLIDRSALIPIKTHFDYYKSAQTKKIFPFTIQHDSHTFVIPIPYARNYAPESRMLTASDKRGNYYIAFDNIIIKINSDLTWKISEVAYPVINLYADKEDGLWICTYKGGVIYQPRPGSDSSRMICLGELSVSGVCEDNEKGIWCTTLEKGVFYCRNKSVITYANVPGLDKRTEFLRNIKNNFYTSSEKSELFEMNGTTGIKRFLLDTKGPGLTDIACFRDTFIIMGKGGILKCSSSFKKYFDVLSQGGNGRIGANQISFNQSKVYGLHRNCLIEIKNKYYTELLDPLPSAGKCILASRSHGLLLGSANGVYLLDTVNFSYTRLPGIDNTVLQIMETHNGKILAISKESGLYELEERGFVKPKGLLGLGPARFSYITEDKQNNLWLASNIGLIRVENWNEKGKIKIYNSNHGLISDEVLRVAVNDDRVFLSSYDGLCSFPLQQDLINTTPPPIYLNCIKVNGKKIKACGNDLSFAHNENSLLLSFDVPAFRQGSAPLKLFYQVISDEQQSLITKGTELMLSNLSPGNYKIKVYAANSDGLQSAVPVLLSFTIRKPFWQTPFFLLGVVLALIGLTYFVTRRIIMRVRKKEEEKTRVNKLLAEYQMSALRAQMNPHFIFNCINSIQRYILTNKADEAYEYLSKFSKLIRLVLNYAEENLISLAQELEIVELYLELEQLRFENKFNYKIELEGDIDANELMVPVMIMQPYIENAIWHGLMNLEKNKTGHLHIAITLRQQMLIVTIEDNGIGLKKAALLRKKGHRSKGTHINSKRAEILNIMSSGTQGGVVIDEITAPDGAVAGTRVIINIPQNNPDDE